MSGLERPPFRRNSGAKSPTTWLRRDRSELGDARPAGNRPTDNFRA
jgi:hypothetical protein